MGWIVFGVMVLIVLWAIAIYNGLVRGRVAIDAAWAQIDVQLKRRYDLIPNLIETVKGYAAHESKTFEAVVQARQQAIGSKGVAAQATAENALTASLHQLVALREAYPDLKASQNFLALQEELSSTENRIGFARQHYNDSVNSFNGSVEVFPAVLIANAFRFEAREFFELEEGPQREAPRVSF